MRTHATRDWFNRVYMQALLYGDRVMVPLVDFDWQLHAQAQRRVA